MEDIQNKDLESAPTSLGDELKITIDPNAKPVLALFSGGVDSTYMIHQLLLTGPVEAVQIYYNQCVTMRDAEYEARKKIARWFHEESERGHLYPLVMKEFNVNINDGNMGWDFGHIPHQILAALHHTHNREYKSVAIGYVNGDDSVPVVGYIQKAWQYLVRALHLGDTPHPELTFPLIMTDKSDIIARLHPQLLEMAVWCDFPTPEGDGYKTCGGCESCIDHYCALERNRLRMEKPLFKIRDELEKSVKGSIAATPYELDHPSYVKRPPGEDPPALE